MPSTKFLFWNINRKPLPQLIASLAEVHGIDVIVLAECEESPAALLTTLNATTPAFYHFPLSFSKIRIFTGFAPEFLKPVFESERISIRHLRLPARDPVILAAVHLPSKLHWSDESQAFECVELARQIERIETEVGHRRTILVGDFNMNPFEPGMASSVGLNSVMSRQVASRTSRNVQGRDYHFFYNPMWNHLGDAKGNTAGTYFHDAGQHLNYYWNAFDQVLLRPELAARFDANAIQVVKQVGHISFVRPDGRPDATSGSDHLPLVFAVEF